MEYRKLPHGEERVGFSSHTQSVANRVPDTGLIDLMMQPDIFNYEKYRMSK